MIRRRTCPNPPLIDGEDTTMPELFTTEFPSQGSSDLWGFNRPLAMVLAFIIVPIVFAALVLIAGAAGRLLSAMARAQSTASPIPNRFDFSRRLGSRISLHARSNSIAPLDINAVPVHQRQRTTVQRPRAPRRWRRF